jgi:hypothetical protein
MTNDGCLLRVRAWGKKKLVTCSRPFTSSRHASGAEKARYLRVFHAFLVMDCRVCIVRWVKGTHPCSGIERMSMDGESKKQHFEIVMLKDASLTGSQHD